MATASHRVLFLCTGNSARSILAEAIANCLFAEHLAARSAGSQPKGEPHPLTLKTLAANELPTDQWKSESWNAYRDEPFDLVITLCDGAANESCPVFSSAAGGEAATVHWPLPDPPAAEHPEDVFAAVFEVLTEAIGYLVHGPEPTLSARATQAGRQIRQRFAPRAV